MAHSKMNVFHFNIVGDQSFPYQSRTFPQLSEAGAYDENHVYSQGDIAEIIEFARQRGIRVVIEFNSPGLKIKETKKKIKFLFYN
jgi:hexosaminidase